MTTQAIPMNGFEPEAPRRLLPRYQRFGLVHGVRVPNVSCEAFDLFPYKDKFWTFTINVSPDRIRQTYFRLAQEVRDPGYLVIEVGTPPQQEQSLPQTGKPRCHKDVYYRDGISCDRALDFFSEHDDLFVHDARVHVGFGSHRGLDEVYLGPSKVFRIFTDAPQKYESLLKWLDFPREVKLRPVCGSFTPQMPGRRTTLPKSPERIERMLADLQARGLYFAERREDDC